jgi:hypothetical protein
MLFEAKPRTPRSPKESFLLLLRSSRRRESEHFTKVGVSLPSRRFTILSLYSLFSFPLLAGLSAGITRQVFYATSRFGLYEIIRDWSAKYRKTGNPSPLCLFHLSHSAFTFQIFGRVCLWVRSLAAWRRTSPALLRCRSSECQMTTHSLWPSDGITKARDFPSCFCSFRLILSRRRWRRFPSHQPRGRSSHVLEVFIFFIEVIPLI